jgi:hypothetical protein
VVLRLLKFHEATHIVGQLYGVPHGILRVFNTTLYENEFQNPQIFQQTISPFPEQSTLAVTELFGTKIKLQKSRIEKIVLYPPLVHVGPKSRKNLFKMHLFFSRINQKCRRFVKF